MIQLTPPNMHHKHFPVPYNLRTLPSMVYFSVRRNAKRKCLSRFLPNSVNMVSYTYIDFFRMASLLSEAFNNNNSLEIRKNDKIAVYAYPCPEIPIIMLAAAVYNLNVLLISPDLSYAEIDDIYAQNKEIKATFTTIALQQAVPGEKIFLDDDERTRKAAMYQPEFKPPKKMLFYPAAEQNFDEYSQIISSDGGMDLEGNYSSYISEAPKEETLKGEKMVVPQKVEPQAPLLEVPSILMRNTFHTFIGYAAEDLGVFYEKNPLYDNYLVNILHYETSSSDETAPFLTVYNSTLGQTFTQGYLITQIVKLARTRFLKQRISSGTDELHREGTLFADFSVASIVVMFAALLNGAAIVSCSRKDLAASIDIAAPTFLYLPLECKQDLFDLLAKNAKIDVYRNRAVLNSAQFKDIKQYCTSYAIYPFDESCYGSVGGQLRVMLVEGLSEEDHQYLTAYLNCYVLGYSCQPSGLFLTVQDVFSHTFGQIGENFTDADFELEEGTDGTLKGYGVRVAVGDDCLRFVEFERGGITSVLKYCCEDRFNLICGIQNQVVLVDKMVSGNVDGHTVEMVRSFNQRLTDNGIGEQISMVIFCKLGPNAIENYRLMQRAVDYGLSLRPGADMELACQQLKKMGVYQ